MKGKHLDTTAGGRVKTPRTRGQKVLLAVLIVVLVLLALMLAAVAWWKLFTEKPLVLPNPDAAPAMGEEANPSPASDSPIRVSGEQKEDFYTFLVIGRDTGGGGNTDTILLAAYDTKKQALNVMSIPRDTMVNVPWDVKKINSVYNFYGGGDKGLDALGKEVAQLVGFVPNFQVVLEWKAVGELVDALGGVYYDVPRNMNYRDPTQNLTISVKKGYQKLDGKLAMQVVRFREGANGYANGDLGRIETQQGFLKAMVQQCLQIKNVTRINELSKVFTQNVKTNLKLSELAWFADKAIFGGLKMENVSFVTMPCQNGSAWSRSYGQNLSYVVPLADDLVKLVNQYFNPFATDLNKNELDIMTVKSGGGVSSTTGRLEDPRAASGGSSAGKANTGSADSAAEKPGQEENASSDPAKPAGEGSSSGGGFDVSDLDENNDPANPAGSGEAGEAGAEPNPAEPPPAAPPESAPESPSVAPPETPAE
jgi:LCP family protein required for cell wall assembly